jgi:hypothetical protein
VEAHHWTDTLGYFHDLAAGVEADHLTKTFGYFHDLAADVEADHWKETVGYFHDLTTIVEADHWTVIFGYFHNQTALCVVYFIRKLDVSQSWCGHVGTQAYRRMVIMQPIVSVCA